MRHPWSSAALKGGRCGPRPSLRPLSKNLQPSPQARGVRKGRQGSVTGSCVWKKQPSSPLDSRTLAGSLPHGRPAVLLPVLAQVLDRVTCLQRVGT